MCTCRVYGPRRGLGGGVAAVARWQARWQSAPDAVVAARTRRQAALPVSSPSRRTPSAGRTAVRPCVARGDGSSDIADCRRALRRSRSVEAVRRGRLPRLDRVPTLRASVVGSTRTMEASCGGRMSCRSVARAMPTMPRGRSPSTLAPVARSRCGERSANCTTGGVFLATCAAPQNRGTRSRGKLTIGAPMIAYIDDRGRGAGSSGNSETAARS